MINPDEFYKKIERELIVDKLRSTGQIENAFWQHIGHFYNHESPYIGKVYDNIIGNIERMMTGQKPHGFEQNKKTDVEKLMEKGRENI